MKLQILAWTLIAGLSLFAFQNCGGGFETIPGADSLSSRQNSNVDDENPNPTPSPSVAPVKTTFFFGRSGGIDGIELDSHTGQVRELASSSFQGNHPGWLAFEEGTKTLLAAEEGSGKKLQTYSYNSSSQTLASKNVFTIAASTVHLTLVKTIQEFFLFGSSYDQGRLDSYKLNTALTTVENSQTINFGSTAKAHSSAFDPQRNLLFVAPLGLNKISVYRFDRATGLSAAGEIAVPAPRTVVYDRVYDKLYVASEAYSGNSYIYAFSIQGNGSYTFTNVGSLAMPLRGADIKVNHAYGYVMALARQPGQQAIFAMPVAQNGVKDTSRLSFNIPITQVEPRSLEFSADGRYAIVSMNSSGADNVVVYKMDFDSNKAIVSSEIIWSKKFGNYGIVSSIALPSEP